MVDTTLRILRSQGVRATGINQIVRESRSPRGSIYHHFPGGKEQLVLEALRVAGEAVAGKIRGALDAHADVAAALRAYIDGYAEDIRASDYRRGCPVANVAMDAAATSPAIRHACDEIFAGWAAPIARRLEREGRRPKDAAALAEFVISTLEGALILCRARRSTEPLAGVAARLETLLGAGGANGVGGSGPRTGARPSAAGPRRRGTSGRPR
jgi:TetR/AcrR family transcriptional repressor of lmrAB and yxaGH operons